MKSLVATKALTKRYAGSDHAALLGLELNVGEGEIFGLLGPNGAGKTTLISILTGLLPATSGSYKILGHDHRTGKQQLKGQVGIVPQEYALYPGLTARENLVYFGKMNGMRGPTREVELQKLLDRMGLGPHANKKVSALSGGMKRMVNLLAGIIHKPALLFLDEPTVGVDVDARTRILELITDLHASGMSIFYTSHLMDEAERLCTHVAILNHGRLMCQGAPKELIASHSSASTLEQVYLSTVQNASSDA